LRRSSSDGGVRPDRQRANYGIRAGLNSPATPTHLPRMVNCFLTTTCAARAAHREDEPTNQVPALSDTGSLSLDTQATRGK
jgi:hypothetical protein